MKERRKKDGNIRFLVFSYSTGQLSFQGFEGSTNNLLRCMMESPKSLHQPDMSEADMTSQKKLSWVRALSFKFTSIFKTSIMSLLLVNASARCSSDPVTSHSKGTFFNGS